jgi:hypothetical protein
VGIDWDWKQKTGSFSPTLFQNGIQMQLKEDYIIQAYFRPHTLIAD